MSDELQGARMIDADRFNGKPVRDKAGSIGGSSAASCGIAFMAKASAPGRAKTRLVPPLTYDQAADLNTAFLQDVADNLVLANLVAAGRGANARAAIAGYAAYGPPGSGDFFRRILPQSIGLIEAWLPNFGDCLFHTVREILARGHDFSGRAQCRQPNFADRVPGRDGRSVGAARRSRGARSVKRRRLLPLGS